MGMVHSSEARSDRLIRRSYSITVIFSLSSALHPRFQNVHSSHSRLSHDFPLRSSGEHGSHTHVRGTPAGNINIELVLSCEDMHSHVAALSCDCVSVEFLNVNFDC